MEVATAENTKIDLTEFLDDKGELIISDWTEEMTEKYGLDFQIKKLPMKVIHGIRIINSGYFGLLNVRTGEVINSVKPGYHVSQTDVVVELAKIGMRHFRGMKMVKAGEFDGGRKVYIQIAIEGDALIGNDTVKRFVTIIDSNDGTASLSVGIGDRTLSCENQFFAFAKKGESKFRHSKNMAERIKEIPNLIEFALLSSMRMTEIYTEFQKTICTKNMVNEMIVRLLETDKLEAKLKAKLVKEGKPNETPEITGRAKASIDVLTSNIRLEMNGGMVEDSKGKLVKYEGKGQNLWGLFSGVTRWTTHAKSAPKRENNSNGRLEGIMSPRGTNYKANQEAFGYCLETLNKELKANNKPAMATI